MSDKPRLLIVDDQEETVDLLALYFRDKGYDVLTATRGEDALAIAKVEKIDAVTLDIMMPDMDGYHLAHQLSRLLGREAPKILIISGRNLAQEKAVAYLSGAAAIMGKPFKLEDVEAKITEILKARV